MISIQLNDTCVQVGSVIQGSVAWGSQRSTPHSISIIALWRTEGRGNINQEIIGEQHIPFSASMPFAFAIPAEGPISYDGKLIRIIWEIQVEAQLAQARKDVARQSFHVAVRMW